MIGELLARRARLDPDRAALIEPGRTWTYRELDAQVDRVAAGLVARGVSPGDRVAIIARNGAGYVAHYFAAARIGAILVGVNWRLAAPEIDYILGNVAPRLVVCADEFRGRRTAVAIDAVAEAHAADFPAIATGAPLAICHTSGTTGQPKGAVLTHAQLCAAARAIEATVDYRLQDTTLIATPLFHVGGLSFATLFPLRGATAVLAPAWVAPEIGASLVRERVNHFFAVPAMLDTLLPELAPPLPDLRWIMTGAAPLPQRLIDAYGACGIPLLQSYGATETAGPATCMDRARIDAKPGSIGRPFFGTDVRIAEASDGIGELQVRGGHVFDGYWNDPQASQAAFDGEWLRTGDVGTCDAEGYFHLVDRKKEVIISGGENVYPAEVERVLAEHPAIGEVAVVGVPDERWGEAVCAFVVPRPGAAIDPAMLRDYCRGRIAAYKIPSQVVVRDAPFERNATGKILKQRLRA